MRPAIMLAGLSTLALALTGTTAQAAGGSVDGNIVVGSTTCTWANATTSDVPPNTLTVDHASVNSSLSCSGGTAVTLTNDPTATFDDAAGTGASPEIDVNGTIVGVTCGYRATNVTFTRQSTDRVYTGGPFTASKTSGSFLCPSSETIDSATLTFH